MTEALLPLPTTRHSPSSFSLFALTEGIGFGRNVGCNKTGGLSTPVRVADRLITGASELSISAREGLGSLVARSPEAFFSRQEEEC